MQQVRIFKSIESEIPAMEEEINAWVKESGATIVHVTGNIAPQTPSTATAGFSSSDVLVVVLYELTD